MKLLPIRPHRQRPSYCGPASLKMVLGYYGRSVAERQLGRLAGTTAAHGTPATGLVRAAEHLGFRATWRQSGTIAALRQYVRRGVPVIVNWFSTDEGHYSVVVGLDQRRIALQDPELGRVRWLSLDTFRRVWFDFPGDALRRPSDLVLRGYLVVFRDSSFSTLRHTRR